VLAMNAARTIRATVAGRTVALPSSARIRRFVVWVPLVMGLAYALVLLVHFPAIISGIYRDSDAAAAPVLAQLSAHAPAGSRIILGDHPWYEEFFLLVATRGFPLHRQLWLVGPLVWCVAGLALLFWTARRVAGNWAAMVTVIAVVCVGPLGRHVFLTWNTHGLAALHCVIVGAVLVWLTPRVTSLSMRRLAVGALILGLFSAMPTGSDRLFILWGLVPFVATAGLIAWRTRTRAGWHLLGFALASTLLALLAGAAFSHVMQANGVHGYPIGYKFVAGDQIGHNATLLIESMSALAGGDFLGSAISTTGLPVAALGSLVLLGLLLVLAEMRRRVRDDAARPKSQELSTTPQFTYFSYWTICLVVAMVAFVGTSAPVDVFDARYLLGAYLAVGALLPALALRGVASKIVVAAGVSLFAVTATYELQKHPVDVNNAPGASATDALMRFADHQRISYGYAGYWDALELTWGTKFHLNVYPVQNCAPRRPSLCREAVGSISSWYIPRPNTRSMLVVDGALPGVTGVDPALGIPVATATIAGMRVYVYPYDIATKLG
jgi:hypothetical protein